MKISLKSLILLLIMLGVCVYKPASVTYACEFNPYSTTNYWFKQNYTIDDALLPLGIQRVEIVYERDPILGQFKFKLEEGGEVYVVGLEDPAGDEAGKLRNMEVMEEFLNQYHIAQVSQEYEDRYFYSPLSVSEPESVFLNNNQPYIEDRPIPEPHTVSLFIVQDSTMQEIPVEVSYEPNPEFKIDQLISGETTSLENIIKSSDAILIGEARSRDQELSSEGYVFGNAEITVSSWIRGVGEDNIILGTFGRGDDCLNILKLDTNLIFFVQQRAGSYSLVGTTTFDISPWKYSESNLKEITEITGQEVQEVVEPKTRNEEVYEPVLVDRDERQVVNGPLAEDLVRTVSIGTISIGLILLLLMIGAIMIFRRQNNES